MNKISGVYKITNMITGDFYIGSSKNIRDRWFTHRAPSRWVQCPNSKLYQDMVQYGRDNFEFEILEETTELKLKEQYWIEQLNPSYNNYRAKGQDIERQKKATKEWNDAHREERQIYKQEWYGVHREEQLDQLKDLRHKLCLYGGEKLTLSALSSRFQKIGIARAWLEAKKYLLDE